EGLTLSYFQHLLQAQAIMPPTECNETAGFGPLCGNNDGIRDAVMARLNAVPAYRTLFGKVFPEVAAGAPIDRNMFGKAIAEFEFSLTFAQAPIDLYATGNKAALTDAQKRG